MATVIGERLVKQGKSSNPNPDKPEPKLKDKAEKDMKKISSGTHKGKKQYFPDFLSSIFAINPVLKD
jgi:hypothetical protein